VKRHDEGAEREMDEGIQETADLALLAQVNEKLNPDARLQNVRKAGDEKEDRGEFLDGYFHAAGLRPQAHLNKP
jgi:TATA-binding protein-associated factor Taf7